MSNPTDDVWSYGPVAVVKVDPLQPSVEIGAHRLGSDVQMVVLAQENGPRYVMTAAAAHQLIEALEAATTR